MFRHKLGAALVAALALALTPGCGSSTSAYIPDAASARGDLDTALAAWQKGGKSVELTKSEHPIYMVDSKWDGGQELESYQILEEKPSQSETEKHYGVTLKMKKPPGEKTIEYIVVGQSPMWIFRDEDYEKQGSMGETPRTKSNTKRASSRQR